jgi:hypothetical protein
MEPAGHPYGTVVGRDGEAHEHVLEQVFVVQMPFRHLPDLGLGRQWVVEDGNGKRAVAGIGRDRKTPVAGECEAERMGRNWVGIAHGLYDPAIGDDGFALCGYLAIAVAGGRLYDEVLAEQSGGQQQEQEKKSALCVHNVEERQEHVRDFLLEVKISGLKLGLCQHHNPNLNTAPKVSRRMRLVLRPPKI